MRICAAGSRLQSEKSHAGTCFAAVRRIPRGPWAPSLNGTTPPLAYIVVEGTLLRAARIGRRCSTELLGPEDVLRPWDDAEGLAGLDRRDVWTALETVAVAVLDWRFAAAAARWPQLLEELMARSARRSARLMTLMCVRTIRRLDVRVLVRSASERSAPRRSAGSQMRAATDQPA